MTFCIFFLYFCIFLPHWDVQHSVGLYFPTVFGVFQRQWPFVTEHVHCISISNALSYDKGSERSRQTMVHDRGVPALLLPFLHQVMMICHLGLLLLWGPLEFLLNDGDSDKWWYMVTMMMVIIDDDGVDTWRWSLIIDGVSQSCERMMRPNEGPCCDPTLFIEKKREYNWCTASIYRMYNINNAGLAVIQSSL